MTSILNMSSFMFMQACWNLYIVMSNTSYTVEELKQIFHNDEYTWRSWSGSPRIWQTIYHAMSNYKIHCIHKWSEFETIYLYQNQIMQNFVHKYLNRYWYLLSFKFFQPSPAILLKIVVVLFVQRFSFHSSFLLAKCVKGYTRTAAA